VPVNEFSGAISHMRRKRKHQSPRDPRNELLRPATPFERRMLGFGKLYQVPPLGSLEAVHLQRLMGWMSPSK
jgi:hypothetical protein